MNCLKYVDCLLKSGKSSIENLSYYCSLKLYQYPDGSNTSNQPCNVEVICHVHEIQCTLLIGAATFNAHSKEKFEKNDIFKNRKAV